MRSDPLIVHRRPRRVSPWYLRLSLVMVVVALPMAYWRWWIEPIGRHARLFHHLESAIGGLALHRPPGVPAAQWRYAVDSTYYANEVCCSIHEPVDLHGLARFSRELDERIGRGSVDMSTIDWIWDEFERITCAGHRFSRDHRPTRPDRLAEAASWSPWVP